MDCSLRTIGALVTPDVTPERSTVTNTLALGSTLDSMPQVETSVTEPAVSLGPHTALHAGSTARSAATCD